jgi:hypothetical protein
MSWQSVLWRSVRSLLALTGAVAVLVAGTIASGELASALRLPAGGDGRLAWDLSGVILAGTLAFWVAARAAPTAPRGHARALLAAMAAVALWAVLALGADHPLWFRAGLLLSLPLQYLAGMRAAR